MTKTTALTCRLAALLLLTCSFSTTPIQAAPLAITQPGVPQSCAVQLKTNNFSINTIDELKDMGFTSYRRGVYWKSVEKVKGFYDFSDYDKAFDHSRQSGLTVIGCLFGDNKLYEDDGRGGIQTQAGREGFANFAAAVAAHYKDHNILWEVWNEPNIRTFWRKDGTHNSDEFAQEYTDLVKTLMPVVLKANPDAFVMAGSVSNYWEPSYNWTEACFKKGILQTGIRAWSVHPYGVKTPEEFSIGHELTRKFLKQYGAPDMIMINSERGFAYKKPQDELEQEGFSGGKAQMLREYQAWHFVRQFMMDQINDVRLTSWYEWDGEEFGLMDATKSRPIYTAAKVMMQRLNGYELDRRIPTDEPRDYLLLWKNAAGQRQLVLWTSPTPGGAPDEALPHEVTIQTNPASSSFDVMDLYGKAQTLTQLKLTISGSPQYVALPAGLQLGQIITAKPAPQAIERAAAAEGQNLDLFTSDEGWQFLKNTGEGSFAVGKSEDGEPIGIVQFDFTNANSKSTPYIIVIKKLNITSADAISLDARTELPQQLTFRVSDTTDQTLQFKTRLKGGNQWETIQFPLNRKLEHWGGANDGKVHFPVTSLSMNVPRTQTDKLAGKVEYARAIAMGAGSSTHAQEPKAAAPSADPTDGLAEGDLKLFESGVQWKFLKNTGEGSFTLATDSGKAIGVLAYDFTKSMGKSTPYVLAGVPMKIAQGATALTLKVRSDVAQKLTFRVIDGTNQTLQYKTQIKGISDWETITIPLNRKLEHWGGDNDGMTHFPIKHFYISVPLPSSEHKQGKLEVTDAIVVK